MPLLFSSFPFYFSRASAFCWRACNPRFPTPRDRDTVVPARFSKIPKIGETLSASLTGSLKVLDIALDSDGYSRWRHNPWIVIVKFVARWERMVKGNHYLTYPGRTLSHFKEIVSFYFILGNEGPDSVVLENIRRRKGGSFSSLQDVKSEIEEKWDRAEEKKKNRAGEVGCSGRL